MKARSLMVAAVVLCASAFIVTVCRAADERDKADSTTKASVAAPDAGKMAHPQKAVAPAAKQAKPATMTGSYIPGKIKTTGRITDGEYNVTIIDRDRIERSGGADVAQILAREPGITIRSSQ
jgi:outer membrane cobalamin receptor